MNAEFKKASTIIDIFNGIVELIPIIKIDIDKNGWKINCLEPNGCSFVDVLFHKNDFNSYKVKEKVSICFDLKLLLKIIGKMSKSKPMLFTYQSTKNGDKMNISQGTKSKYKISLLDVEINCVDIPALTYDAQVNISSSLLKETFDKMSIFSETCRISTLKNKQLLLVSSNGIHGEGREEFELDIGSTINLTTFAFYPLPYLQKFMKANKVSDEVCIRVVKDKPISFHFKIDNSYLTFFLAPKVEDDTDISQQGLNEEDLADEKEDNNDKKKAEKDDSDEEKEKDEEVEEVYDSGSDSEYEDVEVEVTDDDE